MPNDFKSIFRDPEGRWGVRGYATRFQGFQNLMLFHVSDILLVSSLYDSFILEEDGRLYEMLRKEYEGLSLSHTPSITHVSSGDEALGLISSGHSFDVIITTLHIEDMSAARFAKKLKESGESIPLVLMAYDNREQSELMLRNESSLFDRVFLWQGDFRILIAAIKYIEDRMNVDHDTRAIGVQSIIVIEDDVRYYSSFLPIVYTEIHRQSQRLIAEGINVSDRYLRMRARPKILLCSTFEEAWKCLEKYEETILGVISDIDFQRGGVHDPAAGLEFAKAVKARRVDIPMLLQSTDPENEGKAHAIGTSFLLKDSPTFLHDLRQFMGQYFSFGDFIFRTPDGIEVGRASDLKSLEEQLQNVPAESIEYHAERNHFSNWLKARTEFWLAHKLRPRKVSDYPSVEGMRSYLIASLQAYRRTRQLGQITEFDKATFDPTSSFARISGGSLGGKARGLGFVNTLIHNLDIINRFEGVEISVPPALVLGTDVFDQFLDDNNLREFALRSTKDEETTERFLEARLFPQEILVQLSDLLDLIREPLAVRSSTLLEDSQYHPFAGVYETYMIPNNHPDPIVRLEQLLNTIKRVYASTFYQSAKEYIKVTSYLLEEEKMAVIIQKMVGAQHGRHFYPDFAGVARSHNFYPILPQKASDGIVSIALGLGKYVVDGGNTVRFCPKFPQHVVQFASTEATVRSSQTEFFALDMDGLPLGLHETHDTLLKTHSLAEAEHDGTLHHVGSTYSPDDDMIHDGLLRRGRRVVTFAPILRHKIFPLPGVLQLLLDMGSWGMGTPVELEFAVNMSVPAGTPMQFGLLQIRPLVLSREADELEVEVVEPDKLICQSEKALGHGVIKDIYDIVVVDRERFDRSKSVEVAMEVSKFNERLVGERRPYLLIGVGRWGTFDPWLGIPVKWDQIAGARVILETGFKDFDVTPSQGTHFFQNITSFMVGYFTVSSDGRDGFVDWKWISQQQALEEKKFTRHIRLAAPLEVKINGRENRGVIFKPKR
jgi:CheY-like chemotaxis protein